MDSTPDVVNVQHIDPGVVLLTMQDRVNKNAFTDALAGRLRTAFASIGGDRQCKVVIMTGYDSYFCSGGTEQALRALHAGHATFADAGLYGLPLECEIPVIAAMQGHGIGGGFVFGLFSDIVILSRESLYTANFMRYGFTPGMGATCVLPRKLGAVLASEMLFGARSYRGGELERRGVPFTVLRRVEVLEHARQLARDIADKPRAALVALKRHLSQQLTEQLPRVIAAELAMHGQTIHEPDVIRRIEASFGR